jgi:hypothetical protein
MWILLLGVAGCTAISEITNGPNNAPCNPEDRESKTFQNNGNTIPILELFDFIHQKVFTIRQHDSGTGSVPVLTCGARAPTLWGSARKKLASICPTPDGNRSNSQNVVFS